MILYIDTTNFEKGVFAISDGKRVKKKIYKLDPCKSNEILQILEGFLKTARCPLSAVRFIQVNKGPGSYTGTRIGITIANALSMVWNVPAKFAAKKEFRIA